MPSPRLATLAFVSRFDLDFAFDIDIVYFDYLRHFDLAPFDFDGLRLILLLFSYPPPPPLRTRSADSPLCPRTLLTLARG